jgi:hypothetical protein
MARAPGLRFGGARRARPAPFPLRDLKRAHGNLAGTLVALGLVLDFLTLGQAADTRALESGRMHEYIIAASIRGDETIALLIVVEFDGPTIHFQLPLQDECTSTPGAAWPPPADPFEFWKELTCTQPQSGETANRPAKVEPTI